VTGRDEEPGRSRQAARGMDSENGGNRRGRGMVTSVRSADVGVEVSERKS